jgi:hypothetical protein
MKFKSQVYTQASGSIGGVTYSHNQGGMYTRGRAIPVNANTSQQQVVRNIMATLTALWVQTLTQAQRDAWATYSLNVPIPDSLGEPRDIGGLAMYARCNIPRLQAGGLARVDIAPTVFTLGSLSAIGTTADVSAQTTSTTYNNTDGWATVAGGALLLYQSRANSPATNYFKGPYRLAGLVLGAATPPTSPVVLPAIFPFALGNRVFMQARATFADGRLSSPFRVSSIVVA